MAPKSTWPIMGVNHQWDAPGRRKHPLYLQALEEAGIEITSMWYGEMATGPSRINDTAKVFDQWENALPGLRHNRQLFNQWQWDDNNNYVHDYAETFIQTMANHDWKITWVLMDGPSQRAYSNEPGIGVYFKSFPLPSILEEDPVGSVPYAMEMVHASQVNSFQRLLAYLKKNNNVWEATNAFELVNEPDTYSEVAARTSTVEGMTYYVRHCRALFDMIEEAFPGNGLDIYVGGWKYSALANIFHETYLPEFGMTGYEALRSYIGADRFVWSIHLYPSWVEGNVGDMAGIERGIENRFGIPLKMGQRIAITETNSQTNHFNNLSWDAGQLRKSYALTRHTELLWKNNLSVFWWPFANWANGSILDARGSTSGDWAGIQNYHQASLMGFMNMSAYNNNDDWFTGPDSGIRGSHFVETVRGTLNDPIDPDYEEKLNDDGVSMDAVDGYALGFGGRGVAVVQPVENANNLLFGGNGRNILYGSQENDDFLALGRGGGVIRLNGGYSYANTNGGKNLIYAGSKWSKIDCFFGTTTVVVDPDADMTIIVAFNPLRGDRISLKGAFANATDLRYASSAVNTRNGGGEVDLFIDMPGGGRVRFVNGGSYIDNLGRYVMDFTDGWYGPGWSEPVDYTTADFDLPIVDPDNPDQGGDGGDGGDGGNGNYLSQIFDYRGNQLQIFDHLGNPIPTLPFGV